MTTPANRSQKLDRRRSRQARTPPMRTPNGMASTESTITTTFVAQNYHPHKSHRERCLRMIRGLTIRSSGRTAARGLSGIANDRCRNPARTSRRDTGRMRGQSRQPPDSPHGPPDRTKHQARPRMHTRDPPSAGPSYQLLTGGRWRGCRLNPSACANVITAVARLALDITRA
jgi:hypothetical protein